MTERNSTRAPAKVQHDKKTLRFIERSKAIHGDSFNYDKAVYVNGKTKIFVICCECGYENHVLMCNHIYNKSGCRKCYYDNYRWSNKTFERRSRKAHGDKYEYHNVDYVASDVKVAVTCPVHGDFLVRPNNHVRGSGCPECARVEQGWTGEVFAKKCQKNNNGLGILYVLSCYSKGEKFYKVGITSRSVKIRYSCKARLPYKYKVEYEIENNPDFIYKLEHEIHTLLKDKRYIPDEMFKGGQTECFETIKPVEGLLKRLATSNQLKLLA